MLTVVQVAEKPLPPRVAKCLPTSRDVLIIGPLLDAVRSGAKQHIEQALAASASSASSAAQRPAAPPPVLSRWHLLLLAPSVRRGAFVTCESYADLMRDTAAPPTALAAAKGGGEKPVEESFPLRMQTLELLASSLRTRSSSGHNGSGCPQGTSCRLLPRAGDSAPTPFALRVLRIGSQVSRSVRDEMALLEQQTPLSVSAPFFKLVFASLYFCLASPHDAEEGGDREDEPPSPPLPYESVEHGELEKLAETLSPSPMLVPEVSQQAQSLVRAATLFGKMGDSDYDEAIRDSAVASDNFTLDPKSSLREALTRFYYQLLLATGDLEEKHAKLLHGAHCLSPADQYQVLSSAVSPAAHLKQLRDVLLRDFSTFLSLANAVIRCIKHGLGRGDVGPLADKKSAPFTSGGAHERAEKSSAAAYDEALASVAQRIALHSKERGPPRSVQPSRPAPAAIGSQRAPAAAAVADMLLRDEQLIAQHRDVLSPNYRIRYGLRHPVIVPKVDNDALMQNLRTLRQKCDLETSKQMSRLAEHDEAVEKGKTVSARRHELLTMTTAARSAAVTKIVGNFGSASSRRGQQSRGGSAGGSRQGDGGVLLQPSRGDESIGRQLEETFEHDATDYTVLKGAPRGASDGLLNELPKRDQRRGVSELPDLFGTKEMLPTWESESHGFRRPSQQIKPFTLLGSGPSSALVTSSVSAPAATSASRVPPSRGYECLHDFNEYVGLVEKQRRQVELAEMERRRVAERKREVYLRSLPHYVQVFLR